MTRRKTSERLLEKIRKAFPHLDIPEGAWLGRSAGSYAGWNRSSLGAWVWTVYCADGVPLVFDSERRPLAIGSQWTMTELIRVPLAANPDRNGDVHIEPTDEAQEQLRKEKKA
ncbi:hypothetical protein ACFW2V_13920 [Streptomyces sp. NPDC058947]|uniref:hypothetical protein n=1 Tax=Streptomyces sp. NPDC058947 TaxID=3346675 RepID=UPI0036AF980E